MRRIDLANKCIFGHSTSYPDCHTGETARKRERRRLSLGAGSVTADAIVVRDASTAAHRGSRSACTAVLSRHADRLKNQRFRARPAAC